MRRREIKDLTAEFKKEIVGTSEFLKYETVDEKITKPLLNHLKAKFEFPAKLMTLSSSRHEIRIVAETKKSYEVLFSIKITAATVSTISDIKVLSENANVYDRDSLLDFIENISASNDVLIGTEVSEFKLLLRENNLSYQKFREIEKEYGKLDYFTTQILDERNGIN